MSKRSVYEEPETLRLLGLDKRREKRDPDEEFLRELDRRDMERAADRVEELSAGYVDWRGFPLPGFESPRFLSEREREYKAWYRGSSPEAKRARRARER
jgi:hypothetical protein